MELAVIVLILILVAIVASIGASIILIALVLALAVGVLTLVQLLLGWILEKICGKRPSWILSKPTFAVEAVIAVILFYFWFTTPIQGLDVPTEDCAYIAVSHSSVARRDRDVTDRETIEEIGEALAEQKVTRRINVRFLNEGMVDGNNGLFLTFYEEDGTLIRKVRIIDNQIGVSKKEQGRDTYYVYYNFVDKTDIGGIIDKHKK